MQLLLLALPLLLSSPATESRVLLEARDGTVTERRLADFETRDLRELGAVWLRFSDARPSEARASAETAILTLVGGDRLRGRVVDGDEDGLVLELSGGVRLSVSIDQLESVVFEARVPAEQRSLLVPAEEGDRLYRRTGDHLDRIDGAVDRFGEDGLGFESVLGVRTFDWGEVGALFVETFDQGGGESSDGDAVVCDLVDGSRLRGELVGVDRRGCRLRLTDGEELLIPVSLLSEIALDDGSVAYLSDLVPTRTEEGSPFGDDLGMRWPHRMDRAVTGGMLTSGGRSFTRGIGVHAPSRLAFDLGGTWDELRGEVAIDDSVLRLHARGSVEFRVFGDGELLWESGVVRGGAPPVALPPIPMTGVEELVLEADMATEFAVADRANWLRPVLVRAKSSDGTR